jgi:hypothetical protein
MRTTALAAAAIALGGLFGAAQAATVNGFFYVTAINALNQNASQSEATDANAQAAFNNAYAGVSGFAYANFEYDGMLDFGTDNGTNTTIAEWLASGVNGSVTNLDPTFGALQLSKGDVDQGTATTTFFVFTQSIETGPTDFTVTHDDGFALYQITDVAKEIGGSLGPNTVMTTPVPGFTGGFLAVLYVATNADPSILKVDIDVAPVPLPAGFPLLAAGLAGLAVLGMRRRKA